MSKQNTQGNIDTKSWLTLAFLSIIWGSSFILMKKALISFQPMHLAAARVLITGIALSPILFLFRKEIVWKDWWKYALVGLIGNGLPAVLFFTAQTQISSSLSGLLNSMVPIWTLVLGILIFGLPVIRTQILGVIIGFIGASVLILGNSAAGESKNIWFGLLVILATMSYGLSGNVVKRWFQNTRPLLTSAGSFAGISIIAATYLCIEMPSVDLSKEQVQISFAALLALGLIGTALATIIFYGLLQRTNAVFGSTVAYFMPIIALIWGALDGEQLSWIHGVGSLLILLGVYIVRMKKKGS